MGGGRRGVAHGVLPLIWGPRSPFPVSPGRGLRPLEPPSQVPADCPGNGPGTWALAQPQPCPWCRPCPPCRATPACQTQPRPLHSSTLWLLGPSHCLAPPTSPTLLVRQVLDVPLTVKIRTGIQERVNLAHRLLPDLREWGAALVTVGLGAPASPRLPTPSSLHLTLPPSALRTLAAARPFPGTALHQAG